MFFQALLVLLDSLTEFWTIFMRCLLILVTMAGISTTFSRAACSRVMSMAISVPVLPTPALHTGREGRDNGPVILMTKFFKQHIYFQCTYYTISNPSWPAVHQCRSPGELHLGLHSTEVVEDWTSVLWNTMVWPGGKVELCHLQLTPSDLVTLHGDEYMQILHGKAVSNQKLYCCCMCA